MGIFDIFKKKQKDNRVNYDFEQEDRELSLKIRRQKAELKQLEMQRQTELDRLEYEKRKIQIEQELEELRGVSFDEEEETGDSVDNTLITLLAGIFAKNNSSVSPPPIQQKPASVTLTNEQITEYLDSIPKPALKIAKNWNDEQLSKFLETQMPNLETETINRAISLFRKY